MYNLETTQTALKNSLLVMYELWDFTQPLSLQNINYIAATRIRDELGKVIIEAEEALHLEKIDD